MRSILLNVFSIFFLVLSVVVMLIIGILFLNPNAKLNPFPPETSSPVATITPEAFDKVRATPVAALGTPTFTATIAPSETPIPSATPSPLPSPTATMPTVFIAVIGDYGLAGDNEADVAKLVANWDPDFIITTGDNNYPDGSQKTIDTNIGQYYSNYIYPYFGSYESAATENRFFPSLGNHDWRTANAEAYLDYFTLPGRERYYSYTYGPVTVFAIDSDFHEPDGTSSTSLQAQWLQLSLSASESPWKIVYFHHAPYSSGMHGSTKRMRWPFEFWGASAVIAGHDHVYERLRVGGIPYFINGAGGKSLYYFRDPLPESEFRYNKDFGAMLIEASGTSITFKYINRLGTTIDEYTIDLSSTTTVPTSVPNATEQAP